jgi:hypothetical protein
MNSNVTGAIERSVIAMAIAAVLIAMTQSCERANISDNTRFESCVKETKQPYACRGTTIRAEKGAQE